MESTSYFDISKFQRPVSQRQFYGRMIDILSVLIVIRMTQSAHMKWQQKKKKKKKKNLVTDLQNSDLFFLLSYKQD